MTRALAFSLVLLAFSFTEGVADEPSDAALVAEIPFDPHSPPSRVMIDLAPEGNTPFVMELDTGASGSVLTPGMARALGVNVRATRSTPYRKATRLGRDLQFWVDTSRSDTGSGAGYDYGLLGGNFLDDYVLEIDYPRRYVRFYDSRKFSVPKEPKGADEAVLSFRRSGTRVLVDVEIDGQTVLMLLDTGAPAVLLAGREARKVGIEWDALPELEGVAGVLGPIKAYTYTAKSLRFGGFELSDQPIAVAPRGAYNQGGPTDSALGFDVLGHYVVRIDYPNKRLWLRPEPGRTATYWGRGPSSDPPSAASGAQDVAPDPPDAPIAAPTAEEIAENDRRIAEAWEKRRDTRVYSETEPGRFVVVDGYRLRQGPKEGEVWYTHEEMLERKRQAQSH